MRNAIASVFLMLLIATTALSFTSTQTATKKGAKTAAKNDEEILHDIQELEQSLREAFLEGKTAWWDRHLDEHYAGLNPDGVMVRKADLLQLYGSPDVKYEEVNLSDVSARIYDNCVIATSKSAIKGSYKGQDFSGDYYLVHMWVKENRDWMLAHSQATKVAE